MSWVESDPRRCQHEVDVSVIAVSPILKDLLEVELADYLMCGQHCIHISSEPQLSIDTALIKLDLNKAVWVCSNDEVYLCPVHHNDFLNVVNDVWELLLRDTLHALVHLRRLELTM